MKKFIHLLPALFILHSNVYAQNPLLKKWDARFGGTSDEVLYAMQQTNDGGFILAGSSFSDAGGDKTQNSRGYYDFWIVKIDSIGNKEWDRRFGGSDIDDCISVQQTSDGGFIFAGNSRSDDSGDKTDDNWDPTYNTSDYWLVKTDSLGNKLWDKVLGGNSEDHLMSVRQTTDGGYILGGWSVSDASGDKSQNIWGSALYNDYWIVKIDAQGNKQWDRDFGGTYADWFSSIEQTSDGGYIIGGSSNSGISGDKTQDVQGDPGTFDYWILKIDSSGNKLWDKDFGGTLEDKLYSIRQTSDGGYILGGTSLSNTGGDKTQMNWDTSGQTTDYWIIKIDSLGNKQWDKNFGGTDMDGYYFHFTNQTPDGGYLISGTSASPLSGDKTEANLGSWQVWFVKTNSSGDKQWDKTIFTNGHDNGFATETENGFYAFAVTTAAGIAGYKTQDNWDTSYYSGDYWIVTFHDTSLIDVNLTCLTNLCPATCIDYTNLSLNATSYQWYFPGGVPDTSTAENPVNICYPNPGSYDVELIASNIYGSNTLLLQNYITVYSQPIQAITQSGDTLFSIPGASSYQWYFNNNSISGATDYFYVAQMNGDYKVVATDNNGCEVEAEIFNVVTITASNYLVDSWVRLYPNPVTEMLYVKCSALNGTTDEIAIYNALGAKMSIEFSHVSLESVEVNCKILPPGLYYVEITSGKKNYRMKFLKQ